MREASRTPEAPRVIPAGAVRAASVAAADHGVDAFIRSLWQWRLVAGNPPYTASIGNDESESDDAAG